MSCTYFSWPRVANTHSLLAQTLISCCGLKTWMAESFTLPATVCILPFWYLLDRRETLGLLSPVNWLSDGHQCWGQPADLRPGLASLSGVVCQVQRPHPDSADWTIVWPPVQHCAPVGQTAEPGELSDLHTAPLLAQHATGLAVAREGRHENIAKILLSFLTTWRFYAPSR